MRIPRAALLASLVAIPTADAATPADPPARSLYAFAVKSKTRKELEPGRSPTLSPDDRFLATFSQGLAIRRVDGSGFTRLTARELPDGATLEESERITWSPDGKQLAFEAAASCADRRCSGWSVYVIRRDGTSLRRVAEGRQPSWSPRAARIAIESRIINGVARAIVLIDPMGRVVRFVVRGGARRSFKTPRWSRDGERLAFVTVDGDVAWITAARGSTVKRLTRGFDPSWSPASSHIAYARPSGIYTMRRDGTRAKRVGRCDMRLLVFYCREPRWSGDGSRLAWITGREDYQVLWLTAPGRRRPRIATGIVDDTYAWTRDGGTIYLVQRVR